MLVCVCVLLCGLVCACGRARLFVGVRRPEQVVKLLANPLRPVPQCGRGPAQAASKQMQANKSNYKAITSSNMFKSDKKPAFGRVSRRGASRLFSGPDPPPPRPYTRGEGGHPAFRLQAPGHGGTVPGGRGLHAARARFLLPAPSTPYHGELKEPVVGGVLSGVRARTVGCAGEY